MRGEFERYVGIDAIHDRCSDKKKPPGQAALERLAD